MNFFNKYKELFGIHDGVAFPSSKLSINNQLFIDRPFTETYKESASINFKLKEMRKDFNELQNEIQSINNVMKRPRRPISRKNKQLLEIKQRDKMMNGNPYQNSMVGTGNLKNSRLMNRNKKNDSSNFGKSIISNEVEEISNKIGYESQKKKLGFPRNQQPYIEKYNEESYLQKDRIKEEKTINQLQASIPRIDSYRVENLALKFPNDKNRQLDQFPIKIQSTRIENRSRERELSNSQLHSSKKKQYQRIDLDYEAAVKRREESKKNINIRRQKLLNLYRNGH